ncbi:Uma2 family endonuclease [Candidatus Entotheonella palauensis]|uniref:Putative restriction endonuclease domain-containing protein n=1 Tax=Candidatus Entotheonella gemina TaxID=1429439 RepID=W4LT13_9BACT|nr:Uma2 family endonuclease [Candidatus Entotheonella palauensis]ETX01194.1 MAG: hypothetical protein ETSY2_37705 [Candidatus Entotheonella gemina]
MGAIEKNLHIGPELAGTYMEPEEFDRAENWDEGYRYELINGVLIVAPPPGEGARGPNDLLGYLLRAYQEQHPQGSALNYTLSEHTVAIGEHRRRVDRVIWAGLAQIPNLRRDPPTITIEFVSSRRRDRHRDYNVKQQEYGELGVAEYWIIDRFRRTMTVVRYSHGTSTTILVAENDMYTTALLPGFELAVQRLFAEADRLEEAQRDA